MMPFETNHGYMALRYSYTNGPYDDVTYKLLLLSHCSFFPYHRHLPSSYVVVAASVTSMVIATPSCLPPPLPPLYLFQFSPSNNSYCNSVNTVIGNMQNT
eukprot:12901779-Ditylum_brightwellii.AAC.1